MILKTLAAFIAVVLVLIGIVWMQLRAPTPFGVPLQHGVVANVTIVEPGHTPRDRQTLIVRDGVIAEIRDALAEELQGPERFVLPGLIDMHVHQPLTLGGLPDYLALLYLRHGVTSVRYTGYSSTGAALDLHRARVAAGVIPGPRIFSCGPIIDGEPPFWETSIVLTDPAQAEPAVAGLAAHKVDCIKVYSNLERDVLRAVADAAAQRGLTVVGHVPRTVPLEDSGIDDVQHLIGVSGRRVGVDDINPMVDGWDALGHSRIAEVVQHSKANDVAHTPTLVFLWTNAMRDRHETLLEQTSATLLPRVFWDVAWRPRTSIRLGGSRTPEIQEAMRAAYGRGLEVVAELHRHGVRIHAGTDSGNPFVVQGAALLQEIALLAEAGLDNEAALAAASTVPAKSLGLTSGRSIEVGAPADLIVVRRDPRRDLGALADIETVIAAGRFYSAAQLEEAIARYREHYSNITWEYLLPLAARLTR